jgi:hypothetical protein
MPSFSVGEAFSGGWEAMKACYGPLLGAYLIYLGINIATGVFTAFLDVVLLPMGSCFNFLLSIFVLLPLGAGLYYIGVRAFRGERPGPDAIFDGFRRYWPVIGVSIIVGLIMMACMLPGIVVVGVGVVMAESRNDAGVLVIIAGVLAMFVPMIMIGIRVSLSIPACLDPANGDLPVFEAISTSWSMTRGKSWPLFGLYLLMGLIAIGTMLLLLVGLFFLGAPLCMAVYGAAYSQIRDDFVRAYAPPQEN